MNFGADFNDYEDIEYLLPPDDANNMEILKKGTRKGKVYFGLDKWGHEGFVGTLYPPNAKSKDYLSYYVKHFNSIELNATHYKIYSREETAKWAQDAGDSDFVFCPKFLQAITHKSNFSEVENSTRLFMDGIEGFENHLGPIFLQLPENISTSKINALFRYLQKLSDEYKKIQFFVEVRNPNWFQGQIWQELNDLLTEAKIGLVITDSPGRRDAVHMKLTVPEVFIRYVGLGNTTADDKRLNAWKDRIATWKSAGLENVYLFLHLHNEKEIPTYSKKVQAMFS